jgi:Domain of unknown function (DUF222)
VATPAVAALVGLPAGAELLSAVAGLELSSLSGFDVPLVLRAVYRLGNHVRALLLDVVVETMRRKDPQFGAWSDSWDEVGVHEVRAALTMSRTAANSLNRLARDLCERLPQVLAAMRSGVLDQPRARVFSSWTGLLGDEHARAVADALLPVAPTLTTGELIDQIRRAAIELDPGFAQRSHDRSVAQRRVRGSIDREGTGTITGEGLSADQVAAACDRLDAIGWYLKRAGHPGKIDHIRTDVFLGLLTGQFAGLTDEQLLEKLLADLPATPEPTTPPSTSDPQPQSAHGFDNDPPSSERDARIEDGSGEETQEDPPGEVLDEEPPGQPPSDEDPPRDEPPDDEPPDEDLPGPPGPSGGPPPGPADGGPLGGGQPAGDASTDETSTDDVSTVDRSGDERPGVPPGTPRGGAPPRAGPAPPDPADAPPGRAGAPLDPTGGGADPGQLSSGPRLHRRGLRLWVGLGTIAGRDRRPGELLGWGLLHAELARQLSAAPAASWWYVLTDPDGGPRHVGPIRRRPTRPWWDGEPAGHREVEVWLQLTQAELTRLAIDPPPGWARLVADLNHRITHSRAGAPNGDPTDRLPHSGLRRFLAIRDRRCMFPGCRVPSHRCHADHTLDHAHGGPTIDTNLAHVCGADHDLKTRHGWRARQLTPGHLVWTSPLGHDYHRRPPHGPNHTLPPMTHPSRPEDDWPTPEDSTIDREWWTNTCLPHRPDPNAPPTPTPEPAPEPKPEPKPEPQPVPTPPKPEDDIIPF